MLRSADQHHCLAYASDIAGNVTEVLSDAKGFFDSRPSPTQARELVATTNLDRYQAFIQDTVTSGHALAQAMEFRLGQRRPVFSLFGLCRHGQIFVIAVQTASHLFEVYDEFMRMFNEQSRELRNAQQEGVRQREAASADTALLEEYMLLNNELANKQRELAVANNLLQAQEKRFRDLVTRNPDAQLVLGPDNRILFLNPAAEAILGLVNDESRGTVFPLDLRQERELWLTSGQVRICVEVRTTSVNWSGTEAELFSLRDITRRKEMEQMREDVERIVRHDLISPLNPIISLPQILLDDRNLTADQREMIGMIRSAGKRMLEMIRLSLNLYKMEQGTYAFTPQSVDLVATFRDILSDLSERIRTKGVRVRLSKGSVPTTPGDTYEVLAESVLCYSLFSNLVLNSIEASPRKGVVTIALGQEGAGSVAIHNLGAVPLEIRSRFFEKYATSGKAHGTGLGTYSARLMVLTMGGSIAMETSDDSGTTVFVTMPVASPERATPSI